MSLGNVCRRGRERLGSVQVLVRILHLSREVVPVVRRETKGAEDEDEALVLFLHSFTFPLYRSFPCLRPPPFVLSSLCFLPSILHSVCNSLRDFCLSSLRFYFPLIFLLHFLASIILCVCSSLQPVFSVFSTILNWRTLRAPAPEIASESHVIR